jgi:hypothetical protein
MQSPTYDTLLRNWHYWREMVSYYSQVLLHIADERHLYPSKWQDACNALEKARYALQAASDALYRVEIRAS